LGFPIAHTSLAARAEEIAELVLEPAGNGLEGRKELASMT